MKAAVTHDVKTVSIDQVPVPVPAEDEILVRVLTAGICGGDVRIFNGTFPYLNYPIINGHEFCGIVTEAGKAAAGFSPGDYVTAEPIIPCGECYACSVGKINCCSSLKVLGVHVDGCFAEYIAVKAARAYKLPDSIQPLDACMIEPYGIGLHALNRLQAAEGEQLLILGAGPIGLAALDIAKSKGLQVMISDVYPSRLEIARRLGADAVVNPQTCNVLEEGQRFTNGNGFPVVLEATGVSDVMSSAQQYITNGGRICLAGVTNKTVEFSTMTFCNKEATILGTRNSLHTFSPLMEMFSQKKLHPELLRTHVFDLDHYGDAIQTAAQSTGNVCKIVIQVGERLKEDFK